MPLAKYPSLAPRPMKPETIARRARERAAERMSSKASRVERLTELTARHGSDSIWAELLAMEAMTGEPQR